jgi:hypothetical protein
MMDEAQASPGKRSASVEDIGPAVYGAADERLHTKILQTTRSLDH